MTLNKLTKVLIPTGTRADFPRIEPVVELLLKNPQVQVLIAATGSHLLQSHGFTLRYLQEKYPNNLVYFSMFEDPPNDTTLGVANAFARCSSAFAAIVNEFAPDVCLVTVDRIETLAFASICALMNCPILHIQGGEISGTIDENIRHAVSKLAQAHCVANADAHRRLIQMGEAPSVVHNTGCPYSQKLISVRNHPQSATVAHEFLKNNNISKNFVIFCYHPVTTDGNHYGYGDIDFQLVIAEILQKYDVLVLTPNSDLGSSYFDRSLKETKSLRFFKNIAPDIYLPLLSQARALIGNSSSGIREASYFGVPVLNIGSRQAGRLHGDNVIHCMSSTREIIKGLNQLFLGPYRYENQDLYGDEAGAEKIVDVISKTNWSDLSLSKTFCNLKF